MLQIIYKCYVTPYIYNIHNPFTSLIICRSLRHLQIKDYKYKISSQIDWQKKKKEKIVKNNKNK